ncbi:MAG: GNAT family N-acetyltransferase [Pseudomonadota bacterium]
MSEKAIEINICDQIDLIGQADWDACAQADPSHQRPQDPFTSYRFLKALEASGSVGRGTGWHPQYLAARKDDQVIAVAPMYAKGHSQGEYIFDHNWAHAYENAGGRYYPKIQIAAPFTPATGRRFLTRRGQGLIGQQALIEGAIQLAVNNEISSIHVTYCTEDEAIAGEQMGLLRRSSQQFHWFNEGYADFDAFLDGLSSRKRKNIRKERRTAQSFGGQIESLSGDNIKPHHWDAFWRFYQDTGARKWGTPYLTREFFELAHDTMADDMLLVLAVQDGQPLAGALNFIGQDTLYGRYWGCVQDLACMHFELCYYQAIDFAISQGLDKVEAGAQGSHKLARGYMPAETHSLHWIADPNFRDAISRYVKAEREAVGEEISVLTAYGPFKSQGAL